MKSFSKLYSDFWINYDNTEIIGLGADAQLMALYLQGNSHRNILGVYYLPILYIASDLRISVKKAKTTINKLCAINYCRYDERTQYIWICNLAFEQIGEELDIKDNQVKAVHNIWQALPSQLSFLEAIYQKYSAGFYLEPRAFDKSLKVSEISETEHPGQDGVVIGANNKGSVDNVTIGDITIPLINDNMSVPPSVELLPLLATADIPTIPTQLVDQSNSKTKEDLLGVTPPPFSSFLFNVSNLSSKLQYINLNTLSYSTYSSCSINQSAISDTDVTFDGLVISNTPSEGDCLSLEGASKGIQTLFEGSSAPLRSNIEDISKNIDVRSKKIEVKRKKRDIKYYKDPNLNLVAQARLGSDDKNEISSSFSFSDFSILKKLDVAETKLPSVVVVENNQGSVVNPVEFVFEHWKTIMKHPKSHLDGKRKKLISRALKLGYDSEQLCEAITGCSLTPHNIGQNDRNQRYDGLHIILRDADQIDRFVRNCHNPPRLQTAADQRLSANVNVASEWLKSKGNGSVNTMEGQYV